MYKYHPSGIRRLKWEEIEEDLQFKGTYFLRGEKEDGQT